MPDEGSIEELAKERSCCREGLEKHVTMGGRVVINCDECTMHAWSLVVTFNQTLLLYVSTGAKHFQFILYRRLWG